MKKMKTRPVCLFIMDGYGLNPEHKETPYTKRTRA